MTLSDQAREKLALAVQLSASGDTPGAQQAFGDVARDFPGAAELATVRAALAFNQAVGHSAAGQLIEAEALLREALAHAPLENARSALSTLLFHRSQTFALEGKWREATPPLREALQLVPDRSAMAVLADRLSKPHLQTALLGVATDVLAATTHALTAWHLSPNADTYDATWKLCASVGTGFLGKALTDAELKPLLTDRADSYGAWIAYGNVLRRAGRRNAAENAYRRAIALWPQAPFAASRLGALLCDTRRYREANDLFLRIGREFGGRERIMRLDPEFMATLRERPLPEMAGSFASGAAETTRPPWVVLAGCDGVYFSRFASKLVETVKEHCGTDGIVHLHVVNPDAEHTRLFLSLQRQVAPLRLRWSTELVDLSEFGEDKRTYYACARFLQLPHLIRRYDCPILMLDVDSVVLRDLRPLLQQLELEQADLGIVTGDPWEIWGTLWADHVAIRPTPLALEFFTLTANYIRHFFDDGQRQWFLDQIALYAARYAGFTGRPEPRLLYWPKDIQNAGPESYVWSMHYSQPSNRQAIDQLKDGEASA